MFKMTTVWKPVSHGSVFFVYRDSAEDPLDDSGTVQQQLDQVTYMNIYHWYMKHGGQMVSVLLRLLIEQSRFEH